MILDLHVLLAKYNSEEERAEVVRQYLKERREAEGWVDGHGYLKPPNECSYKQESHCKLFNQGIKGDECEYCEDWTTEGSRY